MQSAEKAARLCHLDTLSIALPKLQGAPLESASYLEIKEANAGKILVWSTLTKHLTSNYSEIPYDTLAINTYDNLEEGTNEPTEAYLYRAQDILEHIHHSNDMFSITAIGTNHTKILTGFRDSRPCNKLADLKAKHGSAWCRFCRMSQIWLLTLSDPKAILYQLLM